MASEPSPAPTISSIMAVWNGAKYIEAAIDSLVRQTLPPAEIIVVDDGSTDDSGERAVAAGRGLVRLIRQPNRGMNAARNAGWTAATGDFVHFIDADDIVPQSALDVMHAALLANPGWEAVFGKWLNFWVEEVAAEQHLAAARHLRGVQGRLCLTAAMLRTRVVERAGRFATNSDWHDSQLWLMNLKASGASYGTIDALTLERRVHTGNRSRQKSLDGLTDLVLNLHRAARQISREKAGRGGGGGGKA